MIYDFLVKQVTCVIKLIKQKRQQNSVSLRTCRGYIDIEITHNNEVFKYNPIPGKPFRTFGKEGGFCPHQKNCYKSCLLHANHLKLGTTHLWSLTKISTLVT